MSQVHFKETDGNPFERVSVFSSRAKVAHKYFQEPALPFPAVNLQKNYFGELTMSSAL